MGMSVKERIETSFGRRFPMDWFDTVPTKKNGSMWLPDAAAWLWLSLSKGPPTPWRTAYDDGLGPPNSQSECSDFLGTIGISWRDRAFAACGWLPYRLLKDVIDHIESMVTNTNNKKLRDHGRLRFLVSLDRACNGLSLLNRRMVRELSTIDSFGMNNMGNLCRLQDMLVLPRGAPVLNGGISLNHYLQNLAVLDQQTIGKYEIKGQRLPDNCRLAKRPTAVTNDLVIAFVPTLEKVDDVIFEPVNYDGSPRFKIKLNNTKQKELVSEAQALINKLEHEGVELALFPETVATPDYVEALRKALHNNFKDKHGEQALRLMLVGRLDQRSNEVVALSGSGVPLLAQPKQQAWYLDIRQQKNYKIESVLTNQGTSPVDRREDLKLGDCNCMIYLDDQEFGRILVLICEDMARCDPAQGIAVHLVPTDIVAPVMDASLEIERWSCKAAMRLKDEPGAVVMVVNSCVMTRLMGRHPPLCKAGVGYIAHPDYSVHKKCCRDVISFDYLKKFVTKRVQRPK